MRVIILYVDNRVKYTYARRVLLLLSVGFSCDVLNTAHVEFILYLKIEHIRTLFIEIEFIITPE